MEAVLFPIGVVKNRNRTVCLNVPFLTGSGVVQQKYHLKLVMEACNENW